jgi:hypothetical protein
LVEWVSFPSDIRIAGEIHLMPDNPGQHSFWPSRVNRDRFATIFASSESYDMPEARRQSQHASGERFNVGSSLCDQLGKTPAGTTRGSCPPRF